MEKNNKLISKIKRVISLYRINFKNDLDTLVELEQITDNFSVKFAEWLRLKTAQTKGGRYKLFSDGEIYTLTELLQIFKNNHYK